MRRYGFLLLLLVVAAVVGPTRAQTPTCDRLQGNKRDLAREILSTEHPYDCCDDTIAACLERETVCSLARRLADNVCRRVAENQDMDRIRRALSRRARSLLPGGKLAEIDLDGVPMVGDEEAPVTMVVYACARCPFCSKLIPALHDAITTGQLAGKAKLYFKIFPIRDHPFSAEAALAFWAAARSERFWEFLLYASERFDDFDVEKQADWAEAVGILADEFERFVEDPVAREAVTASKKEGIVNGVEATPTLFVNGRLWLGDLTLEEIVDVVGEEVDRLQE